jgi:Tol biopolymer transport system component
MISTRSAARTRGATSVLALTALAACSPDAVTPTEVPSTNTVSAELLTSTTPSGSVLQLVSRNTAGAATNAGSTTCALSADGSLVLFASDASNLVTGDTNGATDLFLRDLTTGVTTRVTTGTGGTQLRRGGRCVGGSMSPDGRFVAFNSTDNGGTVFVKDTHTGTLTKASPDSGTVAQVTGFFGGALSDDGQKVVFRTQPALLYAGAYRWTNVIPARLMVRDLAAGTLTTLPTDNGNIADGEVIGVQFGISPDGQRVTFVSSSSSLVAGDTNGRADVFVRDLSTGATTIASSASSGAPTTGGGIFWRLSFVSNTQVAFLTGSASSLGDPGYYVKDIASGALQLVLRDSDGGSTAMLSGDTRTVVFSRVYSGFNARIIARDRATGAETIVSASASGTPSNGSSTGGIISRNGSRVAFGSSASNLITPRPRSGVSQIYVRSIGSGAVGVQ